MRKIKKYKKKQNRYLLLHRNRETMFAKLRSFVSFLFLFLICLLVLPRACTNQMQFPRQEGKISPISFASKQDGAYPLSILTPSEQKNKLRLLLQEQLGKPYVYGGAGPDRFDCSGLVQFAYHGIGIQIPRVAQDQAKIGREVFREDLEFGDVVFFSKDGKNIGHDGIYVGNSKMIHAPQTGMPVMVSRIDSAYYKDKFIKAVRLLQE